MLIRTPHRILYHVRAAELWTRKSAGGYLPAFAHGFRWLGEPRNDHDISANAEAEEVAGRGTAPVSALAFHDLSLYSYKKHPAMGHS